MRFSQVTRTKRISCFRPEPIKFPVPSAPMHVSVPWTRKKIPRAMSKFFDKAVYEGDSREVWSIDDTNGMRKRGIAVRTEECTVVIFPDWGCSSQFASVVRKLQ